MRFTVRWGNQHRATQHRITFGRSGDLVPERHNPHMSRVVGEVVRDGQHWLLTNHGRTPLFIQGSHQWTARISNLQQALLPPGDGQVQFVAGNTKYRLIWSAPALGCPPVRIDDDGPQTARWQIDLTDSERQTMATFAIPLFRGDAALLQYREVAELRILSSKTIENHVLSATSKIRSAVTGAGSAQTVSLASTLECCHFLIASGLIQPDDAVMAVSE